MKYCAYCGNSLQDDMQFCPKCGKKSAISPTMIKPDEGQDCKQIEANIEDAPVSAKKEKQSRSGKRKTVVIAAALGIVAAIALVCLLIFSRDFTKSPASIEKATESVVLVNCYDRFGELRSTGSGFIMYDDSTIVTNYHVIDRALDIKISTDEDHTFSVEAILAYDQEKDVAILRTAEPTGLKCLSAGNSGKMKKGENVVAIGSPLGNKNTVSAGILSGRWYNNENGLDELQFSAPISSGSSGGALFDKKGKVIGVTTATFVEGQNLNIAIPIESVEEIYQSKKNALAIDELFRKIYWLGGAMYLSEDNTVDKYSSLIENPERYDGEVVTVDVFLLPLSNDDDNERFGAYASEIDSRFLSPKLICEKPDAVACEIESDYTGYARVCGIFDYMDLFGRVTGPRIEVYYFEIG